MPRFFLCKCFTYSSKDNKKVSIIGTSTNIEIVWYTVEQLTNRIRPINRESFRKYTGHEKRNTYFRGFFRGAVEGIVYQLAENAQREAYKAKEATEKKQREQTLTEVENTSLQVIGMQLQAMRNVDRFVQESIRFGGRAKVGSSLSGQSGRTSGFETGKSMNISSGIGNSSIPKSRRLN